MTATPPRIIDGLSAVAADYDALFCDAWGVIHNGRALFPDVAAALSRFRETQGPVVIITNAPRLSSDIPPQLDRLGLPRDAYDDVVTSGDATRRAVLDRKDLPFFRLGPRDKDDSLFSALPVRFVPLDEAGAILCTGLEDDQTETPADYRDTLTKASERNLPMICANPDRIVQFGDRVIYCAGALADLYAEFGGEVIFAGKPHPPIYQCCRTALEEAGRDPETARILAIGDGLQTDILGANREDLDIAFVADGIFGEEARDASGALAADRLERLLSDYGVSADYALNALKW